MSLCCNDYDVRGAAVKILESCKQIKEQQGVGLGVMQHVSAIESEAYALWRGGGGGYDTKGAASG